MFNNSATVANSSITTIDTACAAPTALTADNISFTTAGISWTPAYEDQLCQLALFDDDELLWQSGRLADTTYVLSDLEENRVYSVLVRAYCSDVPGPWCDTLVFSTAECMPVSDVEFERVDFRTVILTWTPAAVTDGRCRVEYGPEGFVRGTGVVVESASPCRIAGLDPYGNYDFYIQNRCEPGVISDSAVYIHIPSDVGIDAVEDVSLTLLPNPVSDNVVVKGVGFSDMVSLHDATGRCVGRWIAIGESLSIDVSSLVPGAYFVKVVSDTGTAVGKMIVR